MSTTATHTKAGSLAPRRRLVGLAVLALCALGLETAGAATYLARWENNTPCPMLVTGNGEPQEIPAKSTYIFRAPLKDPQDVVIRPAKHCGMELRATIGWRSDAGDSHWSCPGLDHGPYSFVINYGRGNQTFCYCVQPLTGPLLKVVIDPEVSLDYDYTGAYKCEWHPRR